MSTLKEDVILDTLGLAHQYGFQDLETAISDILKQLLALRNVCAILDTAHLYGLEKLVKFCHGFLDRHASKILTHETFLQLSQVSFYIRKALNADQQYFRNLLLSFCRGIPSSLQK